jgi:hypothetical protein
MIGGVPPDFFSRLRVDAVDDFIGSANVKHIIYNNRGGD